MHLASKFHICLTIQSKYTVHLQRLAGLLSGALQRLAVLSRCALED